MTVFHFSHGILQDYFSSVLIGQKSSVWLVISVLNFLHTFLKEPLPLTLSEQNSLLFQLHDELRDRNSFK